MAHYGMAPTTNNLGEAHEYGDVEQAHFRFKQAVDQALRVRGSREFPDPFPMWQRRVRCHFLPPTSRVGTTELFTSILWGTDIRLG